MKKECLKFQVPIFYSASSSNNSHDSKDYKKSEFNII